MTNHDTLMALAQKMAVACIGRPDATELIEARAALSTAIADVIAERDALKQQLETVQNNGRDAARYRMLLNNAYVGIAPHPKPHEVWCLRLPNPSGCANLDEAIDFAMKGTPT